MEASDVTGELRLCMQIISTCDFEDEAYGTCILDIFRDYHSLIGHFTRLNSAITHFINNVTKPEDMAFLKENTSITPVSVQIAAKLFCHDAVRQDEIVRTILDIMGQSLKDL